MSKRSKTWLKKKSELDLQEEVLKGELDEVSEDVEKRVKTVLKISLITGGVFLASYGLYKLFSSSSEKEELPAPKKDKAAAVAPSKSVSSGFSWKTLIIERLAIVVIKFLGAQLSMMLHKNLGVDEESDSESEN